MQSLSYAGWRSRSAARVLEGVPKVLVRNGLTVRSTMESEKVTKSELFEAMRHSGCSHLSEVRAAILENDGKISIIKAA